MFNILRFWLENAYSRPQIRFGGFDLRNWQRYQRRLKKTPSFQGNTSYNIVKIGPPVFAQLTLLPNLHALQCLSIGHTHPKVPLPVGAPVPHLIHRVK